MYLVPSALQRISSLPLHLPAKWGRLKTQRLATLFLSAFSLRLDTRRWEADRRRTWMRCGSSLKILLPRSPSSSMHTVFSVCHPLQSLGRFSLIVEDSPRLPFRFCFARDVREHVHHPLWYACLHLALLYASLSLISQRTREGGVLKRDACGKGSL